MKLTSAVRPQLFRPSPSRVVTAGAGVTIVLVLLIAALGWNMFHIHRAVMADHVRLQRTIDRLDYVDEVLTMSSRMAAATGDLGWEERYRRYGPAVDTLLTDILRQAPGVGQQDAAARARVAADTLLALEEQAFRLVGEGEPEAAAELLASPAYERQKQRYTEAVGQITAVLQARIEAHRGALGRERFLLGLFSAASILVLAGMWLFLRRLVRRYVEESARAEARVRQSEERFRQVTESMDEVFWLTDAARQQMLYMSPAYEQIWGRNREEVYRSPSLWLESVHPDDRERIRKRLPEQAEGTYDVEYRIIRADGELRWIHSRAYPVRDEAGAVGRVTGIAKDITERKQAEEERSCAIALLQSTLESTADGILTTDREGHPRNYSRRFLEMWRIPQEMMRGDEDVRMAHVTEQLEDVELFLAGTQARLGGDRSSHFDVLTFKDGRVYERRSLPQIIGGEVVGRVFSFRDVTEQRRAQEQERELILARAAREYAEAAEERIRSILESITDGFFALDEHWRFTYVNRQVEILTGTPREELLGREIWEALKIPPESRFRSESGRVMEERVSTDFEEYAPLRDLWLRVRAYPHQGGMIAYVQDITERRESEERFRELAENMREVFWMFTADFSTTLYVNPAYASVFGLPQEELYENPTAFLEVVHPEDLQPLLDGMARVAEEPQSIVFRIRRPDGQSRILHARGTPVRNAQGEVYRVTGVTEDVTEQEQLVAKLRSAREEAERASRAKSEMLSRTSHELRTPMNAILGFAQLLETEVEREENRESVEQILRAGSHLLRLIDEVLDIARADSGQMELPSEPVQVGAALREALSLVRPLARTNDLRLPVTPPAGAHRVMADPQRLKQVLLNLLTNAVKYNREGGRVEVRCEEVRAGRIRVEVCDTGPGIAPEKLSRLFHPFDRLDAEKSGGAGGTGLGLALSKALTEAMGGEIGAESTPGEGSTFWVELPKAPEGAHDREDGSPNRGDLTPRRRGRAWCCTWRTPQATCAWWTVSCAAAAPGWSWSPPRKDGRGWSWRRRDDRA